MYIESNHVVYGMGRRHLGRWLHLARDLDVDWYKGTCLIVFSSVSGGLGCSHYIDEKIFTEYSMLIDV